MLFEQSSVPHVRTTSGDHLDRHCTFGVAVRTRRGARNRHFFDGFSARKDVVEETIAAFVGIVLDIDAVQRDVQGTLR